jgi:hypothetical protein
MTTEEKKEKIKSLVISLLNDSHNAMLQKVDQILKSSSFDLDSWDINYAPMILPKCIAIAILQDESTQYDGKGTSYEKEIKKEVKNIKHII